MKPQYGMKKKKASRRKSNPGKSVLNKQGGVYPTTTFELVRAKVADLGTLPANISGTNCGNCLHFRKNNGKIGYCRHNLVSQAVTARQCCIYWRAPGWLTAKKVVSGD